MALVIWCHRILVLWNRVWWHLCTCWFAAASASGRIGVLQVKEIWNLLRFLLDLLPLAAQAFSKSVDVLTVVPVTYLDLTSEWVVVFPKQEYFVYMIVIVDGVEATSLSKSVTASYWVLIVCACWRRRWADWCVWLALSWWDSACWSLFEYLVLVWLPASIFVVSEIEKVSWNLERRNFFNKNFQSRISSWTGRP